MKLEPVTKLDKRNKTKLRKNLDDVVLRNCDVIVIFPICSQFGAIQKRYSRCIICKNYISLSVNFYLIKTASRTKKS